MNNIKTKNSYKWVILAISVAMMMCFSLSLQTLPPLFEQITKDVPFSNAQAGILMGVYAIPGIFLPFLVAYLATRLDIKRMIIVSLIVMMAALIAFSFGNSFYLLVFYRLVAGIGATVLVVLAPILITMFFDQKNIGIAMGVFNTAVPLGAVIAANTFGSLGRLFGWRTILVGVAVFLGLVLVLVIFTLSLQKNQENKDTKNHSELKKESAPKFKGSLSLWFLAGIWILANFLLLSYMTFGSQFYQTNGLSDQRAGFMTSLIMFSMIFLAPVMGAVFDKTGRKKPYVLLGIAIVLISFVALAAGFPGLSLWALILGIGFSPIAVFVFAHLPETVKLHEVGMGMGILTASSNIGTLIGPAALGLILDKTQNNFSISFIFMAAISAIIIALLLGLKSVKSTEG